MYIIQLFRCVGWGWIRDEEWCKTTPSIKVIALGMGGYLQKKKRKVKSLSFVGRDQTHRGPCIQLRTSLKPPGRENYFVASLGQRLIKSPKNWNVVKWRLCLCCISRLFRGWHILLNQLCVFCPHSFVNGIKICYFPHLILYLFFL